MPSLRRGGLARTVCSALCLSLLDDGVHEIGLIVKADNTAAVRLYEGMGFTVGPSTQVCDLYAL
jgi:ribosomal protein S18 acetylase RimI-like enzyme